MAILSLSPNRGRRDAASALTLAALRACRFERAVLRGGLLEGGVLTCKRSDGRERSVVVAMTWDALATLRSELAKRGVYEPDDVIVRAVLRCWGEEQLRQRLRSGVFLPARELVLDSLGGPLSTEPRRLLEAAGLLVRPDAA
jgi:hypothetical protein